jgi:hypothetical protein
MQEQEGAARRGLVLSSSQKDKEACHPLSALDGEEPTPQILTYTPTRSSTAKLKNKPV